MMKRNILGVFLCAVATASALALISVTPARADVVGVNICGKTIAIMSTKMLQLYQKGFLNCYAARHKCAPLTGIEESACLDKTEVPGKPCSCANLDVENLTTSKIAQGLAKAEGKITSTCSGLSDDEFLNYDPLHPRQKLGFAYRRNCMCGGMVGDGNGTVERSEVIPCIRLLLKKAAASQVGWDTDPRAQGDIFALIQACFINIQEDPCVPRCAAGSNAGATCTQASECPGSVCPQ